MLKELAVHSSILFHKENLTLESQVKMTKHGHHMAGC